jgi:hypothetical protein
MGMTVSLKTVIELGEPFAYEQLPWPGWPSMKTLQSRDGQHIVLTSSNAHYLKRWQRELNKAFERGVLIGLDAGSGEATRRTVDGGGTSDINRLRAFANAIVDYHTGSIDGPDIEGLALEHGLLTEVEVTEACGEDCACGEFGFPMTCYRKTALLTGVEVE